MATYVGEIDTPYYDRIWEFEGVTYWTIDKDWVRSDRLVCLMENIETKDQEYFVFKV